MKCDLVLEGGGVKGIALVGAVDVLEENGYEVQRVAGTSAGSIVGAFVAAGLSPGERRDLMCSVDYGAFKDTDLLDRLPGGKLLSLLTEQGVYEGNYLKTWLGDQLAVRNIHTFSDLRVIDSGASVSAQYPSRLLVMASDITHGRLRTLPTDYPAIGIEDPGSVPIADAVRASMSIPFFYEPVKLPGKQGTPTVLVDGGMLSNFPVAVFDRRDGRTPRWPTFGIKLSARAGSQARPIKDFGISSMILAMVSTMTGFFDLMHLDDESVVARTIFVDTLNVKATDFHLTDATRDKLYASGRAAAEKFLQTWDFEKYLATYRSADVSQEIDTPTAVTD